ncbi:MAG: glycoside hydrolase family 27 protein [Clostridia bacterium]|nr:glycoside hydrolase family 27 protein [Clostridia bacterium]
MKKLIQIKILALSLQVLLNASLYGQQAKAPILGWSSWNNFRTNIDESLIRQQADALVASGLWDAGYQFINIDDGYFGGRDASGQIFVDSTKFPAGIESLVDYIHAKNLKAGIYTDAGRNTCGSIWDDDTNGIGVGLYGHLEQDCQLFFDAWGFDFLKIDWCGAEQMGLDEESEYSRIIDHVKSLDSNIVVNVCRWQFPGEWVTQKADSWRISGDIEASFGSILHIIDLNAALYKYASAGHYNDMDMLQVGRGMSYDEDKTHFSMWCMLNSPLLAGNDLRTMSAETIEILTNQEVIALNQDTGYRQATRISSANNVEIWLKPLGVDGEEKAVALMNRSGEDTDFFLSPEMIGVDANYQLRDLWLHENLGKIGAGQRFAIPAHGIVVLKTSM